MGQTNDIIPNFGWPIPYPLKVILMNNILSKLVIGILISVLLPGLTQAQISSGGLPQSMISSLAAREYVPVLEYTAQKPSDEALASRMNPQPYKAGVLVPADVSFPVSGLLNRMPDGSAIWRTRIAIPGARAVILYYDRFFLPYGVRLFLTNENGKQILGAYTGENNTEGNRFATQEVQGDVVYVELNIDKGVSLEDIQLHINRAASMFTAAGYLDPYSNSGSETIALRPSADFAAGSSSVCEINAICPDGRQYEHQRKATMRIIMPLNDNYVGFCTGTLVNNTNVDCTPYVLTASHCEGSNSKQDTTFDQWLFYFNFETPDCEGKQTAPNGHTVSGATFVSRADYDSTRSAIIGDFLLLKLKSNIPGRFNVSFAGWNISENLASGQRYTTFHHPAGDAKKISVAYALSPGGSFNQQSVRNTHWALRYAVGGTEGGSSGSALLDPDGRVVGTLSGGGNEQGCIADTNSAGKQAIFGTDALYSKISRNWLYPEARGNASGQLKPWLDPRNTGALTTNAIKADNLCDPMSTYITNRDKNLERYINIYPNPSTDGIIYFQTNFPAATQLYISVYDITGVKKTGYMVDQTITGSYSIDLSSYAGGTYLISVDNGNGAVVTKKIVLLR